MFDVRRLMEFLDDYRYDFYKECIVVRSGADEAREVYVEAVTQYRSKIDPEDPLGSIPEDDYHRWILDIAIDSVKNMKESELDYIRRHRDVYSYHFGGAMGIRNKYIHNAKKHHFFGADSVSTSVMHEIFHIVGPAGGGSRTIQEFYKIKQVDELYRDYFDLDKDVFLMVEDMLSSDEAMNEEMAVPILVDELKKRHDKSEFVQILKDWVLGWYAKVDGNEKMKEAPYWNMGFRGEEALYPREANQFLCLIKLGIFDEFDTLVLTSPDICRRYIYENMGLQDEDTEFMAQAVWEACSLKTTARWKKIDVKYLRLFKNAIPALYRNGIRNLEDIARRTPKDIARIEGIQEEHMEKITKIFSDIGIEWV